MIKTKILPLYLQEGRQLLKLALPITLAGLIEGSIGFFSILFLARLGPTPLAAGAMVSWLFATLMVIFWGTLTSVGVLVSHSYGAKNHIKISKILRDSLILCILLAIPTSVFLWEAPHILLWLGQKAELVVLSQSYIHALVWGIFPDFIILVLMQFLIGLARPKQAMAISLIWAPINILGNYVFMFGRWGFPALGIAGIGWGTTLAYWITCFLSVVYLLLKTDTRYYFQNIFRFKKPFFIFELFKIGLPIGLMYCVEVGFFLALTLLIAPLGKNILSANQIALQYLGLASILFFSIAQAVTVRMNHNIGGGDLLNTERTAYLGVTIAAALMIVVTAVYWFFPLPLIALDFSIQHTANDAIINYAVKFLWVCAIFQFAEAVRFTLFGALRGIKDTRFTLFVSLIIFWFFALPFGFLIDKYFFKNGLGFWWMMILGSCLGIILLYWRFHFLMKRMHRNQS